VNRNPMYANSREVSRRTALAATAITGAAVFSSMAKAQAAYPSKPVRVIVTFGGGSSPDVVARLWGISFLKATGQPIVVENKAGAATILGAQAAVQAPADGYTILWTVNNTFSINPFVYRKLPYKPEDFVPITRILSVPYILFVAGDSKVRTLDDLLKLARSRPDQLNYASPGIGTGLHVAFERLLNAAGVKMTHVAYKDSYVPDVLAGRIDVAYAASTTLVASVKSGKVRALAVSSVKRIEELPDVPTVGETFPGYVGDSWQGLFVPKGTPDAVVAFLAAQSQRIVAEPEFQAKLREYGLVPVNEGPEAFRRFLVEDSRAWEKVVKDNRIALD
jgi:tripartite-type tricarboxylate transporter receptor subunit TctC